MFSYYVGNLNGSLIGLFVILIGWLAAFGKIMYERNIPVDKSFRNEENETKGIKNLNTINQVLPAIIYVLVIAITVIFQKSSMDIETAGLLLSFFLLVALQIDIGWNMINPGEDFGPRAYSEEGGYPGRKVLKYIPVRYINIAISSLLIWFLVTGEMMVWGNIFLVSFMLAIVATIILRFGFKNEMENWRKSMKAASIRTGKFWAETGDSVRFHSVASGDFPENGGEVILRFREFGLDKNEAFKDEYNPTGLTPEFGIGLE